MEPETTTTTQVENTFDSPLFIKDVSEVQNTTFDTLEGVVVVKHEITLGDIAITTVLMAILIFMILNRFIRR